MSEPRRFIAVAPNGGRRTRADHPALPVTVEALAAAARGCARAGAAMIHLHVRDGEERHVLDAGLYREAIAAVRETAGDELVIQITTESVGRYAPGEQMAVVRAVRPPAVSVAPRELISDAAAVEPFAAFVRETLADGTAVQVIVYDRGDQEAFEKLATAGHFDLAKLSLLMVFGRYADKRDATLADATAWAAYPRGAWRDVMTCAFGRQETAVTTAAAKAGAHVRVGFENNLWLPDGRRAESNADLVAASASALRAEGLRVGTGAELARAWGLLPAA